MRPADAAAPAAVVQVVEVFGYLKSAYDLYKQGKDFLEPQPSTAELIAQAAERIENLVVDAASRDVLAEAKNALRIFREAMWAPGQTSLLRDFDTAADRSLTRLETFLSPGSDPRYAHALAGIYNILLPLYLANHLKGPAWGSPLPRAQLETDFIARARKGLQLDYDFVGGKVVGTTPTDTTTTSRLRLWVNQSAKPQGAIQPTAAHQAVYFKTNGTVQEVQKGAAALFQILQRAGVNPAILFDNPARKTVTVDVTGWTDNWRGRPNAIWTSVQPNVYNVITGSEPCPPDHGMVAVWQLRYGVASFLCEPWPNITPPSAFHTFYSVTPVNYTCSSGFCSYDKKCSGIDFAQSAMFSTLECVSRQDQYDGFSILPTRGDHTRIDKTFSGLTESGVQFDLPAGTALTGYDPTAYNRNVFGYYYATYKLLPRSPFRRWEVPPLGGHQFTSAPAIAMRSGVSIDLFGRGTDEAMWTAYAYSVDEGRTWSWRAPQSLGGRFLGKGSATSWGPSTRNLAVVGRGTNQQAYVSVCASTAGPCSYTTWQPIPNGWFGNDVAITYRAPYLYVVGPGTDNRVYFSRNDVSAGYNHAGWSGWQLAGNGVVNSAVAATVADGYVYAAARASDGRFWWTRSADGASWSSWASLGGPTFASGPTIAGWNGGRLNIAGTASESNSVLLNESSNGGATWSAFQSVGNSVSTAPALWSWGLGQLELFAVSSQYMNRAMKN